MFDISRIEEGQDFIYSIALMHLNIEYMWTINITRGVYPISWITGDLIADIIKKCIANNLPVTKYVVKTYKFINKKYKVNIEELFLQQMCVYLDERHTFNYTRKYYPCILRMLQQ